MKITNTVLDHDMNETVMESALYGLHFAQHEQDPESFDFNAAVGSVWYFAKEVEADPVEAIHEAITRHNFEYQTTQPTPGSGELALALREFDESRKQSVAQV